MERALNRKERKAEKESAIHQAMGILRPGLMEKLQEQAYLADEELKELIDQEIVDTLVRYGELSRRADPKAGQKSGD